MKSDAAKAELSGQDGQKCICQKVSLPCVSDLIFTCSSFKADVFPELCALLANWPQSMWFNFNMTNFGIDGSAHQSLANPGFSHEFAFYAFGTWAVNLDRQFRDGRCNNKLAVLLVSLILGCLLSLGLPDMISTHGGIF